MKRAALLLLLASPAVRADSGADDHMLAGAQYFQAGRFTEALVEFRVAERAGTEGGAIWYVAATLVKLKQPEDALSEFARAEAGAPADRDALFDYYHALGCYDARLYFCSDRLLALIGERAGPRIAGQARRIRADLAPVLSAIPSTAAIDWYHARARAASDAGRAALASAYYEEAFSLAALRADGYRRQEALAGMGRLRSPTASPGRAR
jgi:tetratricopeptide (TPR) repeat protein